jgi:hypothetical protein
LSSSRTLFVILAQARILSFVIPDPTIVILAEARIFLLAPPIVILA